MLGKFNLIKARLRIFIARLLWKQLNWANYNWHLSWRFSCENCGSFISFSSNYLEMWWKKSLKFLWNYDTVNIWIFKIHWCQQFSKIISSFSKTMKKFAFVWIFFSFWVFSFFINIEGHLTLQSFSIRCIHQRCYLQFSTAFSASNIVWHSCIFHPISFS